ncbi:CsbD family protein [Streptomyces sp. PTM05]|uniref:CsbD family protein n=1 Tax=Streptantibioticus parmotrematis TaxID=2873249 RepID=A0ABS7QU69_9ACTN|nr:CsbD family protein [Streptantibioticus parmotrematis]MBY8885362.1 CsbD family protein [Streptantibioticus parmotrematis]
MSAGQMARAKAEQAAGAMMTSMGKAVGNQKMVAKGEAAKALGNSREAKEKGKDTLRP